MAELNNLHGINIPGEPERYDHTTLDLSGYENDFREMLASDDASITETMKQNIRKILKGIEDERNMGPEFNKADEQFPRTNLDESKSGVYNAPDSEPKVFKGEAPRNVRIPDEYEIVGSNAYCGDNSIGTVSIGNGTFVIRDGAFADCKNLRAVDMGDNVTEIDSSAFSGCKKLEAVYLSKNLRDINMNAFRDCSVLEYMHLPENLTSIAAGAFANCTSLEKVVIPESVNYLGIGAFADCKNLKEIDIPDALLAKMERDPAANIANVFKGTQLPIKEIQAHARAYEAEHHAAAVKESKNRGAEIEL